MKQSLQRGNVENFDEKWSKMYGMRKAYWKHPCGSQYGRWLGVPKEWYDPVIKKRFRKKPTYKQEGVKIKLLEPFDKSAIVD
jgi:hypothetical protein